VILPAGKFILQVIAAMAAGLAVLLAVTAWLLSSGPVSLGFLTPYLKEALTLGRTGVRVELEDTILAWAGWDRTLDIRAIGVRLLNEEGGLIAGVPEVSLGLSGTALLDGRLVPTTLDLLRPKIRLLRTREGQIDLGLGTKVGSATDAAAGAMLQTLLQPSPADRRDGFLSLVRILDADLIVVDKASRTTWRAPWADLTMLRTDAGIDAELTADLEIGGGATRIVVKGLYELKGGSTALEVLLADFEPARLATHVDELAELGALTAPISGTITTVLNADGGLAPVDFDLTGGPGSVALPEFFSGTLVFTQMSARGSVVDDFSAVRFDEVFFDAGGPSGVARGLATIDGANGQLAFGGRLEGEFRDLRIDDLGEYWPPKLAPAAREWVTTNIRDGVVGNGKIVMQVSPEEYLKGELSEEALELNIEFDGLTARYLDDLPELVEARGTARMTVSTLDIALASGQISELEITEGNVRIDGLDSDTASADISFVASGPISDGLTALNNPPFEFANLMALDPDDTSGQLAARARFAFPLKDEIEMEEIRFAAAANLRDFGMKSGMEGYALDGGSMVVRIDANGMDVDGSVNVAGVPANVKWRKDFHGEHAATTSLSIAMLLDEASRGALGMPELPWLSGAVPVTAELLADGWHISRGSVTAELTGAVLSIPELIWSKAQSVAGQAKFNFALPAKPDDPAEQTNQGIISNFSYAGGGLEAQGQVEVGPDFEFRRLELSRLKLGESDVTVSLRPLVPSGYFVALNGARFDMRPYISQFVGGDAESDLPRLKLEARLGQMILGDGHVLNQMRGRAVYNGSGWEEMRAVGALKQGAPVDISVKSGAEKSEIIVVSKNGGAFARDLGIFENAIGGQLSITATIDEASDGRPVSGQVIFKKFKVVDAPTLTRILTVGSLADVADLLAGTGISFDEFEAPFVMQNGMIKTEGARGAGSSIGINFDGVVDRNREQISLAGTLVPANILNTVPGKIPILGDIFVGGKGQGLFGVTFQVTGPVSEPKVTVNPLSALAPGILRTIFFGRRQPDDDDEGVIDRESAN